MSFKYREDGAPPTPGGEAPSEVRKQRIQVWAEEVADIHFTCTCSSARSLNNTSEVSHSASSPSTVSSAFAQSPIPYRPATGIAAAASTAPGLPSSSPAAPSRSLAGEGGAPLVGPKPARSGSPSSISHAPTLVASSPSPSPSSTVITGEPPCPSCARIATISDPPPIERESRSHGLWAGVKRFARRCSGRDGGNDSADSLPWKAHAAGYEPGGVLTPSTLGPSGEWPHRGHWPEPPERIYTNMYAHLRDPELRKSSDEEYNGTESDDLPDFIAKSQARLLRAEKLLERLQQTQISTATAHNVTTGTGNIKIA